MTSAPARGIQASPNLGGNQGKASATMLKVPRLVRKRFHTRVWCYAPRRFPASDKPLTVLIPLASKDIGNARKAIASLRRHLLHPVAEIVVAGQDRDDVRAFCAEAGARYINELDVLPERAKARRDDGAPVVNGWVRQQLLKLLSFHYLDAVNVFVSDSDTFLMRDISLVDGDRQLLFLSDEYTGRYHVMTTRLLGPVRRHPRSFIAHQMLLRRELMEALEARVLEVRGVSLIDAILDDIDLATQSCLSEYELYGNYLYNFRPGSFVTRYWYNAKVDPNVDVPLDELRARFGRLNTVSAHLH